MNCGVAFLLEYAREQRGTLRSMDMHSAEKIRNATCTIEGIRL